MSSNLVYFDSRINKKIKDQNLSGILPIPRSRMLNNQIRSNRLVLLFIGNYTNFVGKKMADGQSRVATSKFGGRIMM